MSEDLMEDVCQRRRLLKRLLCRQAAFDHSQVVDRRATLFVDDGDVDERAVDVAPSAYAEWRKRADYLGDPNADGMGEATCGGGAGGQGAVTQCLCIGDYISLYCEETEGYIYNFHSSEAFNGLSVFNGQDRRRPQHIRDAQTVVFQVCIQNRYKLNKSFRKLASAARDSPDDADLANAVKHADAASVAEQQDNVAEQQRLTGKKVRYGEILQLRHVFTGKYVHVSTTRTSLRDKNNMKIELKTFNAKHAQFRILPRYKVKSEGEFVQIHDQVCFESVKSIGHFFHASLPYFIDETTYGSELNSSVELTGFTIVKYRRPSVYDQNILKGGSVVVLFHKELEAFLTADGLREKGLVEDVHLRPKHSSTSPASSGIAGGTDGDNEEEHMTTVSNFWQVEAEDSVINGETVNWSQQLRLRHMTTARYLSITDDHRVELYAGDDGGTVASTVFRLHSVLNEGGEIVFNSYARIEHVVSGYWLHAAKDAVYAPMGQRLICHRPQPRERVSTDDSDRTVVEKAVTEREQNDVENVGWHSGEVELKMILASEDRRYHNAFTIKPVAASIVRDFNFVVGMVPFLIRFIKNRNDQRMLKTNAAHQATSTLIELQNFMIEDNEPVKSRQKSLTALKIVDLLVELLNYDIEATLDEANLTMVFVHAYNVLHMYLVGCRANCLYFAKYISFLQTQLHRKETISLSVVKLLVELIRDNRNVVDRITAEQIAWFVGLLKRSRNYRYLELLSVLCVSNGVGIPTNQNCIVTHWLSKEKGQGREKRRVRSTEDVYIVQRGQFINLESNLNYISCDAGKSWIPLHKFLNPMSPLYNESKCYFLHAQLDLFAKLCYGHNNYAMRQITHEYEILTWDQAMFCLKSDILPSDVRAKYCKLVTDLFVDMGSNYSVLDSIVTCFNYEDIEGDSAPRKHVSYFEQDLQTITPILKDWICEFLSHHSVMYSTHLGTNKLIEEVMKLLQCLIKFGCYTSDDDVKAILSPLIILLDGRSDLPFPYEPRNQKHIKQALRQFEQHDRYQVNHQTRAIVAAKCQGLIVLDLLLQLQANKRLECFVSRFKHCDYESKHGVPVKKAPVLMPLLEEGAIGGDSRKKRTLRRKVAKELKDMFAWSDYFNAEQLTAVLLDLCDYKYDAMLVLSFHLLNKYFTSKATTFVLAQRSQILLAAESNKVFTQVQKRISCLGSIGKAQATAEQQELMCSALDQFTAFCSQRYDSDRPHRINQDILLNFGILEKLFECLEQFFDETLIEQYSCHFNILRSALKLLAALSHNHEKVQQRVYEMIEVVLTLRHCVKEVALVLRHTFKNNLQLCLKVTPKHIELIVHLLSKKQTEAMEIFDLLTALAKVEEFDLPLKRNQQCIMDYLMEDFADVAAIFNESRQTRRDLIVDCDEDDPRLVYFLHLVDLLATCAEAKCKRTSFVDKAYIQAENRHIESLCQTILPLEELLSILAISNILPRTKNPFLRYLIWVYMRTAGTMVESGASDLPHDKNLWLFVTTLKDDLATSGAYVSKHKDSMREYVKPWTAAKGMDPVIQSDMAKAKRDMDFFTTTVAMFLETFVLKFYCADYDNNPAEADTLDDVARTMIDYAVRAQTYMIRPRQARQLLKCCAVLLNISSLQQYDKEDFFRKFEIGRNDVPNVTGTPANPKEKRKKSAEENYENYFKDEEEVNARFRNFTRQCRLVFEGDNTVAAQLGGKLKHPYTEGNMDERLPLGDEFQRFVGCWLRNDGGSTTASSSTVDAMHAVVANRMMHARKLVNFLRICAHQRSVRVSVTGTLQNDDSNGGGGGIVNSSRSLALLPSNVDLHQLCVTCLQVIRAFVHNEERRLHRDWDVMLNDRQVIRQLQLIAKTQDALNDMNIIQHIMPLCAHKHRQLVQEVLLCINELLFNANRCVQKSILNFFVHTRLETFFHTIRARMHLSTTAIKESRSLQLLADSKSKVASHPDRLSSNSKSGEPLKSKQKEENETKSAVAAFARQFPAGSIRREKSLFTGHEYEQKLLDTSDESGGLPSPQSSSGLCQLFRRGVCSSKSRSTLPTPHRSETERFMQTPRLKSSRSRSQHDSAGEFRHIGAGDDAPGAGRKSIFVTKSSMPRMSMIPGTAGPENDPANQKGFLSSIIIDSPALDTSLPAAGGRDGQGQPHGGGRSGVYEPQAHGGNADALFLGDTNVRGLDKIEYKDEGSIELVLKVLAAMCDGQMFEMQNYLREQPNNNKSVNLVAETARFLDVIYSNITADTVVLAVQIFTTLNEFTVGNQANRMVMIDNKVIDYINFILRAGKLKNCSAEEQLDLREAVGNLLLSIIEENGPLELLVSKEVLDTVDKETLYRCMTDCYDCYTNSSTTSKVKKQPLTPMSGSTGTAGDQAQATNYLSVGANNGETAAWSGSGGGGGGGDNIVVSEIKKQNPRGGKLAQMLNGDERQNPFVDLLESTKAAMKRDGDGLAAIRFRLDALNTKLFDVGFVYFLILQRLYDIQCDWDYGANINPSERNAFIFFKKNSMSIEILKGEHLQKINFLVRDKKAIRDNVKAKLLWNIDRSSPRNKLQDLVVWARDILHEVEYQKKYLDHRLSKLFTNFWIGWNNLAVLVSLLINSLMVYTWQAVEKNSDPEDDILNKSIQAYDKTMDAAFVEIAGENATRPTFTTPLPSADHHHEEYQTNLRPNIGYMDRQRYDMILFALSVAHNVVSAFIVVAYFLSNHPSFPSWQEVRHAMRTVIYSQETLEIQYETKRQKKSRQMSQNAVGDTLKSGDRKPQDDDEHKSNTTVPDLTQNPLRRSKLKVMFLSFQTTYYLVFLTLSILGTIYSPYFFAFHLFNIINNNQLLQGVIKAITQNGRSLVWVGILGLVFIYVYSLVAFAFLRDMFDPLAGTYCSSLFECVVTVLRYGVVGDLFERIGTTSIKMIQMYGVEVAFGRFAISVVFSISFFIIFTTIGLNVIFGIIVDTFSELRNKKWTTEEDMRVVCFICSQQSHEFEHHANGFQHHVKQEHSMWAYIYYYIHLHQVKSNDYTSLDFYVKRALDEGKFHFFPMNTALSLLSSREARSADNKLDTVVNRVNMLVEKQLEFEQQKQIGLEKLRQRQWARKHQTQSRTSAPFLSTLVDDIENEQLLGNSALSPIRIGVPMQSEDEVALPFYPLPRPVVEASSSSHRRESDGHSTTLSSSTCEQRRRAFIESRRSQNQRTETPIRPPDDFMGPPVTAQTSSNNKPAENVVMTSENDRSSSSVVVGATYPGMLATSVMRYQLDISAQPSAQNRPYDTLPYPDSRRSTNNNTASESRSSQGRPRTTLRLSPSTFFQPTVPRRTHSPVDAAVVAALDEQTGYDSDAQREALRRQRRHDMGESSSSSASTTDISRSSASL